MLSGFDFSSYDTLDAATLQAQALTSGIYFAYLRASHGLTQDASFASARSDCDSSVVLNGAYHFVMPNEDLDQQTAVFAGQVGVVRPGNLPPCLDFEWTEKKDGAGNITIPEYWQPIAPADRITLILNILRKVETALRVVPAVYTNTNFWHDYIVQPNPNADLSGFARYPLWLVDLAGDAKLPKPWAKAHFVQIISARMRPRERLGSKRWTRTFSTEAPPNYSLSFDRDSCCRRAVIPLAPRSCATVRQH